MAGTEKNTNLILYCLIDVNTTPFRVSCPPNTDVYDMKTLIHEAGKHGALRNIDAKDLVIWKVSKVMRILSLGVIG